MPNINLRLTEEEHAALREWAHGSRRSIQREVIYRLFAKSHLTSAVIETESRATEAVREMTGLKDVVAEYVVEPVLPTPRKRNAPCRHYVPQTRVCEKCDL